MEPASDFGDIAGNSWSKKIRRENTLAHQILETFDDIGSDLERHWAVEAHILELWDFAAGVYAAVGMSISAA